MLLAPRPGRDGRCSHVLFAANGPRRVLRFRVQRASDADDGEWVARRRDENKKKRKTERVGKNVLSATVFVRSFWQRSRAKRRKFDLNCPPPDTLSMHAQTIFRVRDANEIVFGWRSPTIHDRRRRRQQTTWGWNSLSRWCVISWSNFRKMHVSNCKPIFQKFLITFFTLPLHTYLSFVNVYIVLLCFEVFV